MLETRRSDIEQEIIALLGKQDKAALTLIFRHYKTALFGVIQKIVGSEALAADVFQESLVKIWRFGPKYDPEKGRLFTWLLNICRNTAIDKTRLKSFQQSTQIQDMDSAVSMAADLPAEEVNTDLIGLREVIAKMEPKYRDLMELMYFQGYTQQEISDKLDQPLGTVKTRIRTAIELLRKWLKTST